MSSDSHITTRRGFIAAAGFGGVSLYGLWAAYGAAPAPLALLRLGGPRDAAGGQGEDSAHAADDDGAGHGGHGVAAAGPDADEFRRMTDEFIERYRLPDGVVHPRPLAAQPETGYTAPATDDGHAAHAAPATDGGHAAHAAPTTDDAHAAHGAPIDVLMSAGQWYYLPAALRLDAGQPYRFRMMALDVSHGASIQFGNGGRMVRLRPGRVTEIGMSFDRPGRYLMLCTLYCGAAHDRMQATIEVV